MFRGSADLASLKCQHALGTTSTTPGDIRAMVERDWKVWPRTATVDDLANDLIVHLPPSLGPDPRPDIGGWMVWTKQYQNLFPDFALKGPEGKSEYTLVVEGDLVLVQYQIVTTFTRDFPATPAIPANGAVITVPGLNLFRIKDGQVAEFWVNPDTASMVQQMMASSNAKK